MLNVDKQIINLGSKLKARVYYDIDFSYSQYDFLRLLFEKKKILLNKINKSLYGKWH